jgi:membrane-associated protease RseP (regulator of RpoE activity)
MDSYPPETAASVEAPSQQPLGAPWSAPPLRTPHQRGWRLAIALFFVTFITTLMTGMLMEADARGIVIHGLGHLMASPSLLLLGLPYSLSVMGILGTHEMGHYLACRKHGIDATPPYFLPSPPMFLFGTFGAFIRIRAPITSRKVLFDIGVAGPLAGFVVAIPVLIWGTLTSAWRPESADFGGLYLGDCLATRWLTAFVAAPPPEPTGYVFTLSSVGMAGWFGLLATGLNLLPIGQLDGGHIAYAVSRSFHKIMSRLCLAGFVLLGLLVNESWLFWATVMVLLSPRHPLLIEEEKPLSRTRLAVAALAFVILAVSFIPDMARLVVPEPGRTAGASFPH